MHESGLLVSSTKPRCTVPSPGATVGAAPASAGRKSRKGCSEGSVGAAAAATAERLERLVVKRGAGFGDERADLFAGRYAVVDHASDVGVAGAQLRRQCVEVGAELLDRRRLIGLGREHRLAVADQSEGLGKGVEARLGDPRQRVRQVPADLRPCR